jgi:hypothetical protein
MASKAIIIAVVALIIVILIAGCVTWHYCQRSWCFQPVRVATPIPPPRSTPPVPVVNLGPPAQNPQLQQYNPYGHRDPYMAYQYPVEGEPGASNASYNTTPQPSAPPPIPGDGSAFTRPPSYHQ